jgi:hypothetical protein
MASGNLCSILTTPWRYLLAQWIRRSGVTKLSGLLLPSGIFRTLHPLAC